MTSIQPRIVERPRNQIAVELPHMPDAQWCRCRRCRRVLRNPKRVKAGIGVFCERKERAELDGNIARSIGGKGGTR